jgi:predicted metal-dependent phosphotriesterase family hydrolase
MTEQLEFFLQNGISTGQLDEMTRKNPAKLLAIGAV